MNNSPRMAKYAAYIKGELSGEGTIGGRMNSGKGAVPLFTDAELKFLNSAVARFRRQGITADQVDNALAKNLLDANSEE
jgi:hypothetical protein